MRVEIDLTTVEHDAITTDWYRQGLVDAGFTVAALTLTKLDEAIRNATIRVGDIVSWGPQPYGANGLVVLALDDTGVAWCCSENGTYHTVLASELRKPAVTE
jgi:hypothetical protein